MNAELLTYLSGIQSNVCGTLGFLGAMGLIISFGLLITETIYEHTDINKPIAYIMLIMSLLFIFTAILIPDKATILEIRDTYYVTGVKQ